MRSFNTNFLPNLFDDGLMIVILIAQAPSGRDVIEL